MDGWISMLMGHGEVSGPDDRVCLAGSSYVHEACMAHSSYM